MLFTFSVRPSITYILLSLAAYTFPLRAESFISQGESVSTWVVFPVCRSMA